MHDLDDLRAFLEVTRTGSFGRAALHLGVAKSIVSRRVARLERELGAQLLARTTRGVTVTEGGLTFASHAERALAELEAAREAVADGDGALEGLLRIAAPLSFGAAHLAPVLAGFALAHPRLRLHTAYSDRRVDLIAERFDAAIRLGALPDSSLVARRIAPMNGAVLASPGYLARCGTPKTLDELQHHEALIEGGRTTWRFLERGRERNVPVRGRFESDSGEATLAAAIAGVGITLLPTFLAGPAIADGRLVPLLRDYAVPEIGMYLVRPPPPGPLPRKLRLLTELLVERFGGEPYWDACYLHRRRQRRQAPRATGR